MYRIAVTEYSRAYVQQLDFEMAVGQEAEESRSIVPPDIDWRRVPNYTGLLPDDVKNKLSNGNRFRRSVEITAKKPRPSGRPVSYLGIFERIAYRAMVNEALACIPEPDRTPEAWRSFVESPIKLAEQLSNRPYRPFAIDNVLPEYSPFSYVVKADVASFYRYVDHEVLLNEMIGQGVSFESARSLASFLHQLHGRRAGLPQTIAPSHRLAELYVDPAEREMIRKGYNIWRYSDDFRIACREYSDAIKSLDDLERALLGIGLTLNELKTAIPKFSSYFEDNSEDGYDEDEELLTQDDALLVVGKFTEKLGSGGSPGHLVEPIDYLRRALLTLASKSHPGGLGVLMAIVRFAGYLTPSVLGYLTSLAKVDAISAEEAAKVIDPLRQRAENTDWQKMWLIYAHITTNSFNCPGEDARRDWLLDCQMNTGSEVLRAYSLLGLAHGGWLDLDQFFDGREKAAGAVESIYAEVGRVGMRGRSDRRIRAAFAGDVFLKAYVES